VLDNKPIGLIEFAEKNGGFTSRDAKIAVAFGEVLAIAIRENHTRETLESSEERYRLLFESSKDAILIFSHPELKFLSVNTEAVEMFGFSSKEEFFVLTPLDVSPASQLNGMLSSELALIHINKAIDEGTAVFEWNCLRKGDEVFTANASLTRIDLKDGFVLQVNLRDITWQLKAEAEKIEIEDQMRQSQKLESIGQLAGGIAHDFNNMLSVILGYGEEIVDSLHKGDPLLLSAMEIVKAGKRSASLTRQLLAFSRKQNLQTKVMDLNEVVSGLKNMLERLLGEHILLKINAGTNLGLVKADPGQLEQIIMNLAVNGRDAMVNGGKLTISTFNKSVTNNVYAKSLEIEPGSYVVLEVTDNGTGMDEKVLKRMFEPFYTTKTKGRGTGLGLSTVYGIIKQSNGSIVANSEVGFGTKFIIYLPRCFENSEDVISTSVFKESLPVNLTVMVVEDEPSLRKLVLTMLHKEGFKTFAAENGGAALLLVEEEGIQPDLLLTDIVMPGMSGKVLANRLKKSLPQLKILYMSGYSNKELEGKDFEINPSGEINFLSKPFSIKDLREKIRSIIDS
jgi:PAS domain S-box-containing protein